MRGCASAVGASPGLRYALQTVLFLLVMIAEPTRGDADTQLLSARELRAAHLTFEVGRPGGYSLWIWGKSGEAVKVSIDGREIGSAVPRGAKGEFAWVKVGTIQVERPGKVKLALGRSDDETEVALKEKVGFVLISSNRDCRPERLFRTCRVHENKPAAVADERARSFRHNRKTYEMVRYTSSEQWLARAEYIRKHILISTGLWPLPERTPLNVKRFGRMERAGYSVEKVYFESYPGFFVTGNLYLPRSAKPPYPAILCPHGHWKEGRFANEERGSVPGRCINFARQGYVVFSLDMVGYNDSNQIRHHFSYPLWGLSLMGLQLWDNMRALDFLLSIEGVDPERIGCTGASGGGTQTFILAAVDKRVKVAVPVCMVSAHFQGGCECENPPLLRMSTNNVEIAAAAAPRPYMLVAATGDWTKNTARIEGPAIREIYELLGAGRKFHYAVVDAGHNYNKESREHVYRWMGRWLLGETDADRLRERPFEVEKVEDLRVFTAEHPRPDGALDEKGLRDYLVASARRQIESLKPRDRKSLERFRKVYRTALRHAFFAAPERKSEVRVEIVGRFEGDEFVGEKMILSRTNVGDRIPAILMKPRTGVHKRKAVVVHPKGKIGLMDVETGDPGPLLTRLLKAGYTVLMPDCFLTGEHHTPFAGTERTLPEKFPYTYNPTTLACRVQDIVTACSYLRDRPGGEEVDLIGVEAAGPWCLLASAAMPDGLRAIAVDANGFTDEDEAAWHAEMFQPGIMRWGGLRVAGGLVAPRPLLIYNTQGKLNTAWIADVYRASEAAAKLRTHASMLDPDEIVRWFLQK